MTLNQLGKFSAVYCSGPFVPDPAAVTALALLFEKIHLPNNIDIVKAVATKYNFGPVNLGSGTKATIQVEDDAEEDLFSGLSPTQAASAKHYIWRAMAFSHTYADLIGPVFESEMFEDKLQVKKARRVKNEGGSSMVTTLTQTLSFSTQDEDRLPTLISQGYVPVVGRFHAGGQPSDDHASTRQLATLLAMKSIEMVLPLTRPASSEVILEARHRLRDQLPQFWSCMLKTSTELRKLVADSKGDLDIAREATDLVDRTIRPAVIDLAAKLERERKDWFFRVLAPVRTGLRLLVGSPMLTQQQLVTSAMLLASDTCVSIAENMRSIEALKKDSGLTYLLDLSEVMTKGEG